MITIALVLSAFAGATLSPALAASVPAVANAGAVIPIVDRPEIRSYQPQSTLQYGFRPKPRVQRGVTTTRPEIVMPEPVAPLIEYGTPGSFGSFYDYCSDRPQTIEPRHGPYGPRPVGPRGCP